MSQARGSADELMRSGVLVRVPHALREYTNGQDEVLLEALDVASLLRSLDATFPGIRDRVVDETGQPRRYVNVFVNEDLVRGDFEAARLHPGDVVHILPSVAGG